MIRFDFRRLQMAILILGVAAFAGLPSTQDACNAQERFVLVPEEGGVKDLETGLVWGFDLRLTGSYLWDIGLHTETGGTLYSWGGAMGLYLPCNSDGSGFCFYDEFSNAYWGVDHSDWRIPTRDELVAAAQAGIADYLDYSPHDGFQPWGVNPYDGEPVYPYVWSSTEVVQGGKKSAYTVNLFTGAVGDSGKGSGLFAVPVRGVAPPSDEKGNGNGKGKP